MRDHPVTGERMWANQSNLWHDSNHDERTRAHLLRYWGEDRLPTHAFFGDGSPIQHAELDRVRKVLWDNATIFAGGGDVLILDNWLVAHGRTAYEGPRRVLVAMG